MKHKFIMKLTENIITGIVSIIVVFLTIMSIVDLVELVIGEPNLIYANHKNLAYDEWVIQHIATSVIIIICGVLLVWITIKSWVNYISKKTLLV